MPKYANPGVLQLDCFVAKVVAVHCHGIGRASGEQSRQDFALFVKRQGIEVVDRRVVPPVRRRIPERA